MIYVDGEKCAGCGICEDVCPVEAVRVSDGVARIDQDRCNECEACLEACPNEAILMVIEPAEKALSLREKPVPEVAQTEPYRSEIVPVVGAALAFLGREVAPRLVTYLLNTLDRRTSQKQLAAASSNNNLTPSGGRRGEQKGPRHRHRRRGK
jgi:Fe-S-cluster-containing hydrogenase component 2